MIKPTMALLVAALLFCSSCTSAVQEKHLFATFGERSASNPSGVVNVFRLNVNAQTAFSNVRYLAGTYDERAVELFLNETKSSAYSAASDGTLPGAPKVFAWSCPTKDADGKDKDPCKDSDAAAKRLVALDQGVPGQAEGQRSFVIILSTNADAISETIGAFATNTQAMQSLNYLLHKDTFDQLATQSAIASVNTTRETAVADTLTSLFENYDSDDSNNTYRELSILQAIAIALAPGETISFDSIEEAKLWFSAVE